MNKISFGGRAPPEPAGGTYSAAPDRLAGFKGLLLTGGKKREGRGWKETVRSGGKE